MCTSRCAALLMYVAATQRLPNDKREHLLDTKMCGADKQMLRTDMHLCALRSLLQLEAVVVIGNIWCKINNDAHNKGRMHMFRQREGLQHGRASSFSHSCSKQSAMSRFLMKRRRTLAMQTHTYAPATTTQPPSSSSQAAERPLQ